MPSATVGERARVCLRIRPALTEEEGQDNTALQCDRVNKLVWALGDTEEGEPETAPRQYAFDEVLEQHVGQAEVFDIVAMQPVQAALSGSVGCVLCFGASGAGKDFSLRCERPGQEAMLPRALDLIFAGGSQQAAIQKQEAAVQKIAKETQEIADDAQRDYDVAIPALNGAVEALQSLSKADLVGNSHVASLNPAVPACHAMPC